MTERVEVEWVDSNTLGGWHQNTERPGAATVFSLGYILEDNPQELTLAMSYSEDKAGEILTIPKTCVKNIWRVNKSILGQEVI